MNPIFKRIAPALSILGVIVGVILYLYSASLYSDATNLDPIKGGYHHLHNYWCELYTQITYTGQLNAGVSYAKACTLVLVATLFFFWLSVPALFAEFPGFSLVVRIAGALTALAASFVFTEAHDIVITLAAPLGFAAILATCIGLARSRHWLLLVLALLAVGVGMSDYMAWKLKIWVWYQPMIQKSAFVLVFLWVLAGAVKILTLPAVRPAENQ